MNNLIKAPLILLAILLLAGCGEALKTIESSDHLLSITISDKYQDAMDKRNELTAVRLKGTPIENITILETKGGRLDGDIVYAVTLNLPEGVEVSLKEYEEVMEEQMKGITEIVDFKVTPVKDTDNQLDYIAKTNLAVPYYEYCRIAVGSSITSICIGTTNDQDGAKKALKSIQFLK